jgi:hypothetical protein
MRSESARTAARPSSRLPARTGERQEDTMMVITDRRHADGSIDFDFYRAEASRLRNEARSDACRKPWVLAKSVVTYFKFPQNRWMRRQASSRSSVLVA